ncbi:hypothetical protein L2E82_15177 [Cichorium intybus]|uniref:Uncharacterized protein n=1 Tax=Cichorium intybus TaxID=13427 RepID=A0ACB9F2I1_CICIN|nr:hypothetical protein L2E82_15177 [Cichorium intybus]
MAWVKVPTQVKPSTLELLKPSSDAITSQPRSQKRKRLSWDLLEMLLEMMLEQSVALTRETIALHEAMEKAISGSEGSWSVSSSHSVSALQKALATQAHFVDVEIDRTSLKIGEKIASGSSGDLYVYTVFQLHFNIITFIVEVPQLQPQAHSP